MKNLKPLFLAALFASSVLLPVSLVSSAYAKDDARTPINLTAEERNQVLEEMRTLLSTVQSIVMSLSKDDMESLSTAAKKVGMAASGDLPPALTKKLPQGFKILAMKVHMGFDALALDAVDMDDKQQTLEQLGALMNNCVACHATYRLPETK
jgi:cytochrome c556